jgi:hypothetical protein
MLNQDDGEMYDEFGTLKKKFRTKAKPGSALNFAVPAVGVGKAGWDNDIGVVEGFTRKIVVHIHAALIFMKMRREVVTWT